MSLSKDRIGEIALAYVKMKARGENLNSLKQNDFRRMIGNTIKEPDLVKINVTEKEAIEFASMIVCEIIDNIKAELQLN